MAPKPAPRREAIAQVVASLDRPIPLDDFVDRVMELWKPASNKPRASLSRALRYETLDGQFVLHDRTVAPMRLVMNGVRFRVKLDRSQVRQGGLIIEPWFWFFVPRPFSDASLVDVRGRPIPMRIVQIEEKTDGLFGRGQTARVDAIALGEWYRQHQARAGDSILVTIVDWEQRRLKFEHEPAAQRRKAQIKQQNRALADGLYALMEETQEERVSTMLAVPSAYARLTGARDYPGDHWITVVDADKRMRTTLAEILPADQLLPFEDMFGEDLVERIEKRRFTPEQGRQVYRFRAAAPSAAGERLIEIQGKQTLRVFDEIMRATFDLDPGDHLSEFTRVTPRGKGKNPHRVSYGEINPFQDTAAARIKLAELGLEAGALLEYVYDFGDWLEHHLALEEVCAPERGVAYPRMSPAPRARRGGKRK